MYFRLGVEREALVGSFNAVCWFCAGDKSDSGSWRFSALVAFVFRTHRQYELVSREVFGKFPPNMILPDFPYSFVPCMQTAKLSERKMRVMKVDHSLLGGIFDNDPVCCQRVPDVVCLRLHGLKGVIEP